MGVVNDSLAETMGVRLNMKVILPFRFFAASQARPFQGLILVLRAFAEMKNEQEKRRDVTRKYLRRDICAKLMRESLSLRKLMKCARVRVELRIISCDIIAYLHSRAMCTAFFFSLEMLLCFSSSPAEKRCNVSRLFLLPHSIQHIVLTLTESL